MTASGVRGLGLITTLLISQSLAAIHPRDSDLRPWVTIAADGAAQTVTPIVADSKTTSTFPASSPLPTADSKGEGAFLLCGSAAGSNGLAQPFCAPSKDSELEGGKTYFVTWDASLFPSPNTVVQVQGDFGVTDTIGAGHGFTSQSLPASQGFFEWDVIGYNMPPGEALDVQLYLAVPASNGTIAARDKGPRVRIVNKRSRLDPLRRRKSTVFGIILPVIFGLLSLAGIGWFIWWYGRRKDMFRTSGGQGYGVGKSRAQRTDGGISLADGTFTNATRGVEMMPPPRPPPPSNPITNAFHAELERQERSERAHNESLV
ncbi:hypothetical protein C8034_v009463 [Colletotrichum sidae]|uniref:Uncharacterized protein n=1 Tax=Colletotrichum sidae TaxID=1347389 RepID=A0A4R8TL57_9PEZI|nr:hypothetical protein C8034_v009463 [Colletotrichum sidae]